MQLVNPYIDLWVLQLSQWYSEVAYLVNYISQYLKFSICPVSTIEGW